MKSQVKENKSMVQQFIVHMYESIKHCPVGTEGMVNIECIAVPIEFATSHPSSQKFNTYKKYFDTYGCFDKPIEVQKNNMSKNSDVVFLRDGYIRFLIARKYHMKKVPVKWYGGNKQYEIIQ